MRSFLVNPVKPKVQYSLEQAIALLRERCESHPIATVTVVVNLNLDTRIKGQKLKGVFDLPHGITGKGFRVAALTLDPDLAEAALSAGASYAGDIQKRILENEIQWPRDFERLIATKELENVVVPKQSRLARKLKRHKIVPCIEDKTLVEPEDLVTSVQKYVNGSCVPYVTSQHGAVTTRIGRVESESHVITENFIQVLRTLFDTQVPVFGTGPRAKKRNIGKYILGIHLVAKNGALPLDLELIDILAEKNQQDIPIKKNWRKRY